MASANDSAQRRQALLAQVASGVPATGGTEYLGLGRPAGKLTLPNMSSQSRELVRKQFPSVADEDIAQMTRGKGSTLPMERALRKWDHWGEKAMPPDRLDIYRAAASAHNGVFGAAQRGCIVVPHAATPADDGGRPPTQVVGNCSKGPVILGAGPDGTNAWLDLREIEDQLKESEDKLKESEGKQMLLQVC